MPTATPLDSSRRPYLVLLPRFVAENTSRTASESPTSSYTARADPIETDEDIGICAIHRTQPADCGTPRSVPPPPASSASSARRGENTSRFALVVTLSPLTLRRVDAIETNRDIGVTLTHSRTGHQSRPPRSQVAFPGRFCDPCAPRLHGLRRLYVVALPEPAPQFCARSEEDSVESSAPPPSRARRQSPCSTAHLAKASRPSQQRPQQRRVPAKSLRVRLWLWKVQLRLQSRSRCAPVPICRPHSSRRSLAYASIPAIAIALTYAASIVAAPVTSPVVAPMSSH